MRDFIPRKIDINGEIGEIAVKQFDHLSRFLQIQVTDRDLGRNVPFDLIGCRARLYIEPTFEEADQSNIVFIDGEVTEPERGVIAFTLPNGVTQRVGAYRCELWITDAGSGAVISGRPFTLQVMPSVRRDEILEATNDFSALQLALQQHDALDGRLHDMDNRMDARAMTLECLGDSFVDFRSGMCWNCQGFAADEDYFYLYRAGNDIGHLQKLHRRERVVGGVLKPALSTAKEVDVDLEHGNDMTIVTVGGQEYLLVIAGNAHHNASQSFHAWLLETDELSVVSAFDDVCVTLLRDGAEVQQAFYRAAAVKETNTVYLSCGEQIYRATVALDGITVGDPLSAVCHGNQGMDCDNGRLYCVDARSRSLEIIDLSDNSGRWVPMNCLMQGYMLAEPESVAVFGDDVYVNGGTNLNGNTGMSQTLICHGNLRAQTSPYSPKANARNLDDAIALYAAAESDDGDYGFAYRTGFAGAPFNSIYTAWLAAKSLYLLGYGTQFNIHLNVPITRSLYLSGEGFAVVFSSDIQNEYPAAAGTKLVLRYCTGTVSLAVPELEVIGGQINLTGSVDTLTAREGAVIFTASSKEFVTAAGSSNFLIVGRNKIFTRFGTLPYTPYGS